MWIAVGHRAPCARAIKKHIDVYFSGFMYYYAERARDGGGVKCTVIRQNFGPHSAINQRGSKARVFQQNEENKYIRSTVKSSVQEHAILVENEGSLKHSSRYSRGCFPICLSNFIESRICDANFTHTRTFNVVRTGRSPGGKESSKRVQSVGL